MGSWRAIIKEEKIPVMSTSVFRRKARRNSTIWFPSHCSGEANSYILLPDRFKKLCTGWGTGIIALLFGHHISDLLRCITWHLFPSKDMVCNMIWGVPDDGMIVGEHSSLKFSPHLKSKLLYNQGLCHVHAKDHQAVRRLEPVTKVVT